MPSPDARCLEQVWFLESGSPNCRRELPRCGRRNSEAENEVRRRLLCQLFFWTIFELAQVLFHAFHGTLHGELLAPMGDGSGVFVLNHIVEDLRGRGVIASHNVPDISVLLYAGERSAGTFCEVCHFGSLW